MAASSSSSPTKSQMPLISVVIPFYNRADFLAEAVESVISQTYRNWELILIDDGSTDESAAVARRFAENHPQRIFLHAHPDAANRGASSSRNLGIHYSSGEFITFLDSDDVFFADTLETEMSAFERSPEADVVCGTLQYWFSWSDAAAKRERDFQVNLGLETERLYAPPSLLVHNLRAGGRKPGIGCIILKSEFARKFTLFENDFKYVCEDQIFWATISLHGKIYIADACLAKYRQHNASSVSGMLNSGKTVDGWEKFSVWLENYLNENKVEDQKVWQALRLCRRENNYRIRFEKVINFYQRVFPYHFRYKIRDFIVRWRTRK